MGVGDGEGELVAGSVRLADPAEAETVDRTLFACLIVTLSSTKYQCPVVRVQPGALQAVDSSIIR